LKIKRDEINMLLLKKIDNFCLSCSFQYSITVGFQTIPQKLSDFGIVINDEHGFVGIGQN
jgi:hypothetical protein